MLILLVLLSVFCIIFYLYRSRNVSYWRSKGIPTAAGGDWFFGHYKSILFAQKHVTQVFSEMYNSLPDIPFIGFLKMSQPALLIKDPDVIKSILTTDFNSFGKNDMTVDKKVDFLFGNNPFVQYGEEWKVARAHATPSVTYAKLKNYHPVFLRVGDEMIKYLTKSCQNTRTAQMEAKALSSMFTTDTISNAIYGIDNNTFLDKNSLLATLTREILRSNWFDNFKFMVNSLFPEMGSLIGIRFSSKRSEEVLLSLTKRMMKERELMSHNRTDIFQQIIQYRDNGKGDVYTDEYISSHLYGFLLDGYETSSVLIAYTLFELAWHKDIQDRLRTEINEMLTKTQGNFTIEDVENLKYLDMVVSETLRIDVPLTVMTKICMVDYTITEANGLDKPLHIEKGTVIAIPVGSLHMDPKYYPSPEKFDPERFTEEEVEKRHKFVYLPFGEGPRKCFGRRFGVLQSKVAIIKIIENFQLIPCSKSSYPLEVDPLVFLLRKPLNGAWIQLQPIN